MTMASPTAPAPVLEGAVARVAPLTRIFVATLVLQGFHFLEHVAQVVQRDVLGRAEAHGLLGAVVDTEWVHFGYNAALLLGLLAVADAAWPWFHARSRRTRPLGQTLLVAVVAAQAYHAFEHTVRLLQHLATGVDPAPGIVGRVVDPVWFHFGINAVIYGLMIGAFLALREREGAR